jgi:hypothetical protein
MCIEARPEKDEKGKKVEESLTVEADDESEEFDKIVESLKKINGGGE